MRRDEGSRGPQEECRTPNPPQVSAQGRQGWGSDWSPRARLREILRCQQGLEVSKLSSGEAKPVHRTGDRIFSVNILASSKGVLSTSVVFYTRHLFTSFLALNIICNSFIALGGLFALWLFSLYFLLEYKPHRRGRDCVCHIHHCTPMPGTK